MGLPMLAAKLRAIFKFASWATDANNNPTGLVGPTGTLKAAAIKYVIAPSGDTTGVTDAAAMNAAITAAIADGGGVIWLCEGQYYVSAAVTMSAATGVFLMGNPGSVKVKLADNQAAAVPGDMPNMIVISGSTRCGVIGLNLDGNYQNQNMANLAMSFGDAAQGASGNRRDPFTIRYVGAGSACSAAISGNVLTTTVTGGPGGENLSIDLTAAAYDTIAELVAYIDGLAAYTATAIHSSFGSQKSSRLYATTFADIKTAATGVNFTNTSNAVTHEIYGNNIYLINSNECVVSDCDLSNAPHMGVLVTGNSSFNLITQNTGQLNNWRACELWPNAGTLSRHNLITNNQFKNSYHDSIVAEFPGTFRNVIANNTCRIDDHGFHDGSYVNIMIYQSEGNVVEGNTCYGGGVEIQIAGANYNIIKGNTVDGLDRNAAGYASRGVYIKAGIGNIIEGNTLHDPFYDTIRADASASKTVIKNNVLSLNNNGSRYPIYIAASSTGNIIGDNILDGNTNGINDLGTRTILNGVGQNGSNDPASAGNWLNNGVEGVIVQWDNGAGKKRLSQYSGGAWINYYTEP